MIGPRFVLQHFRASVIHFIKFMCKSLVFMKEAHIYANTKVNNLKSRGNVGKHLMSIGSIQVQIGFALNQKVVGFDVSVNDLGFPQVLQDSQHFDGEVHGNDFHTCLDHLVDQVANVQEAEHLEFGDKHGSVLERVTSGNGHEPIKNVTAFEPLVDFGANVIFPRSGWLLDFQDNVHVRDGIVGVAVTLHGLKHFSIGTFADTFHAEKFRIAQCDSGICANTWHFLIVQGDVTMPFFN